MVIGTLKVLTQLVPMIYGIGTAVRRHLRQIDEKDSGIEIAYVILDAVEAVVAEVREALPPRSATPVEVAANRGQTSVK